MENPEKLATLGTQNTRRRQTKQTTQHNMCWTQLLATNTNNVNKTRALLQTTGGKDELTCFFKMKRSISG
jgi:hypothetical protein